MRLTILFLILILTGCQDNEIKEPTTFEKNKLTSKDTSPLVCEFLWPESKLFNMSGSYSPPNINYFENVTISWQSNDTFNPNFPVGNYLLTIVVKNLTNKTVKYYKNGSYVGLLSSGGTKTYTWTGSCAGCTAPQCPDEVSGSFSFSVSSSTHANETCEADIEVKLYTDSYNNPTINSAQIVTYHFINYAC